MTGAREELRIARVADDNVEEFNRNYGGLRCNTQ